MRKFLKHLFLTWSVYRWNVSPSHRAYWGGWVAWRTCWAAVRPCVEDER